MSDSETLIELYRKFDDQFNRHTIAVKRATEKADQAKRARDGIRAAMELDGIWDTFIGDTAGQRQTPRAPRGGSANLTSAIRSVLPQITSDFTIHRIIELVKEINPTLVEGKDASVSSALRRLVDEGQLELIEKGAGKRASRYRVHNNGSLDTATANTSKEGQPT